MRPYSLQVEPVGGCNLRCYHCAASLQDKEARTRFVTQETWAAAMGVVAAVGIPRVEIAMSGEPTLHPDLPGLLWMGRKLAPQAQFNIITNGTMLTKGKISYRDLFRAGVNVIYVDMYAPRERHVELAEASGYPWFDAGSKGAPGAFTTYGPNKRAIILALPPEHWPESMLKRHRMGTWLGNLDWDRARKHGMSPLAEPLRRRCDQVFKYPCTKYDGSYALCCQDFLGETTGDFGNVNDGPEGFRRFWFGRRMQEIRRRLRATDRASLEPCARCDFVSGRADIVWPESALQLFWDGRKWRALDES